MQEKSYMSVSLGANVTKFNCNFMSMLGFIGTY
jgi:hypothetical protein